jgi:hypothetical protein
VARVKTFTNGGSLLPGDLNSIEDDYEFAFSTYKQTLTFGSVALGASTGVSGTVYVLTPAHGGVILAAAGSTPGGYPVYYYDPADWLGNTRTTKLRIRATVNVGGTAPATTVTVGLYQITGLTAGAYTVSAVIAGSTVAFATPGANTQNQNNSGDFTAPSAGQYVLGYTLSAATAAGSSMAISALLQMRQV